jgi:hypothetical protein
VNSLRSASTGCELAAPREHQTDLGIELGPHYEHPGELAIELEMKRPGAAVYCRYPDICWRHRQA